MRALRRRPDDARALAEGRAPGHRGLHARAGRRRRVLPEARPQGRAGLRRDGADRVPVGPPRRRDLPDRDRRRRLGGADGDDHLPPVAGPPRRRRPSRRAAHRPRPAAGHRLRRRRARRRRGARRCSPTSATPASRRPRAGAACTSTCGSSRAGRSPTCATPRSRSGASSSGGCPGEVTTKWWKEERGERIFVDYNQNARDRTIASAYSIRPEAGRAGVGAASRGTSCPRSQPEDFTVATMPARFAEVGDRHAAIDDVAHSLQPLLDAVRARRGEGRATCPIRPTTRRCRASRSACSRRATATGRARTAAQATAAASSRRAARAGADGGGTTGPMSPSGASSRSTITGAWSLGPLPLRACRSTHAASHPLGDRRRRRARGRSASRGPGGTCRRGSPSR